MMVVCVQRVDVIILHVLLWLDCLKLVLFMAAGRVGSEASYFYSRMADDGEPVARA